MNRRQLKKRITSIRKQRAESRQCRESERREMQAEDIKRFDAYAETPNGSARLVAFHDAVSDADDTLEAVDSAIADGDLQEARRLIALGRESLADRIDELKELL